MGSQSDWPIMSKAVETLEEFGVPFETQVQTDGAMGRLKVFAAKRKSVVADATAAADAHKPAAGSHKPAADARSDLADSRSIRL